MKENEGEEDSGHKIWCMWKEIFLFLGGICLEKDGIPVGKLNLSKKKAKKFRQRNRREARK
mgnify:CR=1 FL=1